MARFGKEKTKRIWKKKNTVAAVAAGPKIKTIDTDLNTCYFVVRKLQRVIRLVVHSELFSCLSNFKGFRTRAVTYGHLNTSRYTVCRQDRFNRT